MVYMGSKRRIAKHILPMMIWDRKPGQFWVEPFVGGANMIDNVEGPRIGADANKYLIALYNALKSGYLPPRDIHEGEYEVVRSNREIFPPHVLGYYGFAITFGAKWFASFARNKKGGRYDHRAYNSIKLQAEKIKDVTFIHSEYQNLYIPPNSKIYCDPPYEDTEGYAGAEVTFNHPGFWQWCRLMVAQGHEVYISEYNAPDDFICLWEGKIDNAFSNKKATEKLFTYIPGAE